jgi:hypothetical protein
VTFYRPEVGCITNDIPVAQIQQVGGILTLVNTTLAIGLQVYGIPTAAPAAASWATAS